MTESQNPPGWYLGLPFMHGHGLAASLPEKLPKDRHNLAWIFCNNNFLRGDWRELLNNWLNGLGLDGHIILWFTDALLAEPPNCHARVSLAEIRTFIETWPDHRPQFTVIQAENIGNFGFIVAKRDYPVRSNELKAPPPEGRKLLISRVGAHGDAIMASSILPPLKAQGWNISFMTAEKGYDALREDPHIDQLIKIPQKASPNGETGIEFWDAWAPRYDRVINLTQTLEGTFLKFPRQMDYYWGRDQRRNLCSGSYLEFIHRAAGVPGPYRVKFYPSPAERSFAEKQRSDLGRYVLWCLNGSAVHKWYPHAAPAVCRVLATTGCRIVLTGDGHAKEQAAAILRQAEAYTGRASLVKDMVGTNTIREMMAMAQFASCVVGPETGILNAVSMEAMPKVVFLSHSSKQNLTGDWINAVSLLPKTECYPCHRMHFDFTYCPQDKASGAAACAASIQPTDVAHAVIKALSGQRPQEQASPALNLVVA